MTTELHIAPYNPKNKHYFKLEKKRIKKKLGKKFEIHHIGSTSVSGLGGKRTIDMLILAKNKREAEKAIKPLEQIGYVQKEEAGDKYRIFFNINRCFKKKTIHMHIHLMWKTASNYKRYFLFRDYLRKNKKEADEYYSLKKSWFKKAKGNRHKYAKFKSDSGFVEKIIKKAKKLK